MLREHGDFFAPLVEVHRRAEAALRLQGRDVEARTEARILPNEDREVTWIYPVDDNAQPEDGRLYIRDRFVFDPSEQVLKEFRRDISAASTPSPEWRGYLEQHREAAAQEGWTASHPEVARFAREVALSFPRPLAEPNGALSEGLASALQEQAEYLRQAGDLARRHRPDWKVKAGDPQSSYALIPKGEDLEVVLRLAVDVDGDPSRDRIFLREHFRFDRAGRALLSHSRTWEAPEGSETALAPILQALNGQAAPDAVAAEAFLRGVLPSLLPEATPDPLLLLSTFPGRSDIAPEAGGIFLAAGRLRGRVRPAAAQLALEVLEAVAQASALSRADSSRGWAHFGPALDAETELRALESLFERLRKALPQSPGRTPLEILASLSLEPALAGIRERLLADELLAEADALALESDRELRAAACARFARDRLLREKGFPQAALAVAEVLGARGDGSLASQEAADLAAGRGRFGQKFDFALARFAGEVAKPSMLLGMAAAPFVGTAFEMAGLKFARWLLAGRGITPVGGGLRLGATSFGMGGEALAFTAVHRGFERLSHGPETAWQGAGGEILSAMLLFGGLRLANRGGQRLGAALGNAWRAPIHHGGGLLATTASGYLSRALGLVPDSGQGFGGHFFDSGVMYLQATAGFRLAHHASGGRLQPRLTAFKMRLAQAEKAGRASSAPPLGAAILLRGRDLPDLRLFDFNQGGIQSDFRFFRSGQFFLDHLIFGQEGTQIRVFRGAQGQVYILDGRLNVQPWRAAGPGQHVDLRAQSILHNGALLPAGQRVELRSGDSLAFPGRHLKVSLPRASELFQALAALPEGAQRQLAEGWAKAPDPRAWLDPVDAQGGAAERLLAGQVREVLAGRRPWLELPTELGIQYKVRDFMAAELKRWGGEGTHEDSYSLKAAQRDLRWTPLERSYHTLRALGDLRGRIGASRSLGEIQKALTESPFEVFDEVPIEQAVDSVAEVISSSAPHPERLPYAAGIRQRVRDIYEEKIFREFEAQRRRDGAIPLPEKPEWREAYIRLDLKRLELYALARRGVLREESDGYEPQELAERLYQVLERGRPLALLPRAGKLRGEAAIYQKWAIRTARELFKEEMKAEIDPWTGENISAGNEEAQYRLALHVLNSNGRRPAAGMPSQREIGVLHDMVSRHLDPQAPLDYPVMQETLRRHWETATPALRGMLRRASPEQKIELLHHFFGSSRRRDLSPAAAFQAAFWMGQAGMYRETGLIYEVHRGGLRSTFALGEMDQVSSANAEDIFLAHTHPEIYVDADGRWMGLASAGGAVRTIAISLGEKSRDTSHVLPSRSDLSLHVEQAQRYWQRGFPARWGETPVYAAAGRVLRNWVVHPLGLSEMRVRLGESGLPAELEVRFALHAREAAHDTRYLQQKAVLESMSPVLGIPVSVREMSYPEMLDALPFEVQPLF